MGCELDELLCEAWARVGPAVLADERELKARLARRRTRVFEQVPRAMCVAVRASDQRITTATAAIWPMQAVERWREAEHHVRLEWRLVRDLVRPVKIAWPGEPAYVVRERMGCSDAEIRLMWKDGRLNVRYVKGLGGRKGRPIPVVYTPDRMDPCAHGKGRVGPGRLMEALWGESSGRVPEGLVQDVVRVPQFAVVRGGKRFWGWRWLCPGCGRRNGRRVLGAARVMRCADLRGRARGTWSAHGIIWCCTAREDCCMGRK